MSAIADAIEALERELAGLDDKRGQIEQALTALRRLEGEGMTPVGRTAAAGRLAPKRAKTEPRAPREPRPADAEDGDVVTERILAALRKAGEPVTPGHLKTVAGVSTFTLRQRLAALAKQGMVVLSGVTAGRRVALAGAPAKEALHRGPGRRRRS